MIRPAIFISAVTAEHRTTRQRIANVLTRLGYQPEWQDIFDTEGGDLRGMLRHKIDACEALIHIAGDAYGAGPPTADADLGRVSYTQFEFLYARQQGKKTWLIFPGPACTRDKPLDQLDLPQDPTTPDPARYQAERRQLQAAYRDNLRQSSHLWYEPATDTDLELKIERVRDEFAELRRGFHRWQDRVLAGVALALVLLACVLGGLWWVKDQQRRVFQQTTEGQKVTASHIRAHLVAASERALKEDLAQAEKAKGWDNRERLSEAAQRAHTSRLARIEELAASFVQLESRADATAVFKEMTRILKEEGADAALGYVEQERANVRARVNPTFYTRQILRSGRAKTPYFPGAAPERSTLHWPGGNSRVGPALRRGGGCAGRFSWSCWRSSRTPESGWVERLKVSVRPSVVGSSTSSICTPAIWSRAWRGVSPGARARSFCLRVTQRQ